jgi:SAM-dependent methyltransferase
VLKMPLKDETFDFAYSYGVLHHTPDPAKAAREIARILKKGAPLYLYLYEDHSENFFKYAGIKAVVFLRMFTVRLAPKLLYLLCFLLSPLAVALFSWPAWIMGKFKVTRGLADSMPFNFGTHPFSLTGDLFDRLSAPIEYRFSRRQVSDLLSDSGFSGIRIIKSKNKAGWIAWGYKK